MNARLHIGCIAIFVLGLLLPVFGQRPNADSVKAAHYEKVFHLHSPRQSWLRLDMLPLVQEAENRVMRGLFTVAYEYKLTTSWSILSEAQFHYRLSLQRQRPIGGTDPKLGIQLGTRYYYHLDRNLTEGRQANNLSGHYLGVYLGSRFHSPRTRQGNNWIRSPLWYRENASFSVLGGIQQQLFKFGFFDVAFGVRVSHGTSDLARFIFSTRLEDGWQIFPVAQIRVGIGC